VVGVFETREDPDDEEFCLRSVEGERKKGRNVIIMERFDITATETKAVSDE
jgi:hypothetical protein